MKKLLLLATMCLMALPSIAQGYVDLGLPSGILWKEENEPGEFYSYDQALVKFGSTLPTKEQFAELKDRCIWTWTGNGYKVVGSNGNFIFLPAAGVRNFDGSMEGVGDAGCYWSSTPNGSEYAWDLVFFNDGVDSAVELYKNENRYLRISVRLVGYF